MLKEISNKFFWLAQPSSFLSQTDQNFAYFFLGLLVVGIIFRLLAWRSKNEPNRKVFRRIWYFGLTIGLIGLSWFFFRYENTPILSVRAWMGVDLIAGLVWLLFILKFVIFDYRSLKSEYNRELLKNKYLPKSR